MEADFCYSKFNRKHDLLINFLVLKCKNVQMKKKISSFVIMSCELMAVFCVYNDAIYNGQTLVILMSACQFHMSSTVITIINQT